MKRTETTEGGHSCPPRKVGTIPTEIGTIAADWRIAPLDAVCEPPQYGFTASAEAKGNVRFLRITDITDSGVKWPTVPFCECPEKEFGKYRLAPGDIVFARIGATRRADQSADSSAHSEKQNGDTSPHVTIHKVK